MRGKTDGLVRAIGRTSVSLDSQLSSQVFVREELDFERMSESVSIHSFRPPLESAPVPPPSVKSEDYQKSTELVRIRLLPRRSIASLESHRQAFFFITYYCLPVLSDSFSNAPILSEICLPNLVCSLERSMETRP